VEDIAGAAGAAVAPLADAVLVVPPRIQVHPTTVARLRRLLAASAPEVVGVAAPLGTLPFGSSLVTATERAELDDGPDRGPTTRLRAPTDVVGAVLLRHPVPHDVLDDRIRLTSEPGKPGSKDAVILVDPGSVAVAVEPRSPLAPADPSGIPPFRWRPVVLFLAGDADPGRAAIAHRQVDALLDHDIEARLAVPTAPPGTHRTQPCLPVQASVRALVPDCIVALDPAALDRANEWSHGNRTTVVIELDADLAGDRVELVPWTIGHARGRLRARVGGDLAPAPFAALVNRLCSGPQPEAPTEATEPARASSPAPGAVNVTLGDRVPGEPAAAPTRRVWVQRADGAPGPLLAGLIDHLTAAGHEVIELEPGSPAAAHAGDIVLRDGRSAAPVPTRPGDPAEPAAPPLVIVLDEVAGPDTAEGPHPWSRRGHDPGPAGAPPFAGVVVASGALGPRGAATIDDSVARIGLPVLPTRARAQALRAAADRRFAPATPILGWTAAGPGEPGAATTTAVVEAVGRLLDRHRDLHVDIVGAPVAARDAFAGHDRVALRSGPPDPDTLATWVAQIWTPEPGTPGDDRAVGDAALAGVPTVLAVADAHRVGGLADRRLAVDPPTDPDRWVSVVELLLVDERRATAADCARDRARALVDGDAPALTVRRLIGWYDAVSTR